MSLRPLPSLDELARDPERAAGLTADAARTLYPKANALAGTLLARALAGDSGRENGDGTPEVLTPEQAAELANVPVSWIRAEARAGRLPSAKLGHYVRIRRDDLLRFLKARRRGES